MENQDNNLRYFLGGIVSTLLFAGLVLFGVRAFAEITYRIDTPQDKYEQFSMFSATTTTATSTTATSAFPIAGAREVNLYFSRGGASGPNVGSTLFLIQVTPDGTTWYDYKALTPQGATTTFPATHESITISAATSTVIAKMRDLGFQAIRCIARETTDGEHTCSATATW